MSDDRSRDALIDAKLATVEARTETRFVELSGKIDRVVDSISSLGKEMSQRLGQVERELGTVRADNKTTRMTIVIAVAASVIAGIGAIWVTQANLLTAFQTGLSIKTEQPAPKAPAK